MDRIREHLSEYNPGYISLYIYICRYPCENRFRYYSYRLYGFATKSKLLKSQASLAVNVTFSDELWFRLCGVGAPQPAPCDYRLGAPPPTHSVTVLEYVKYE